MTAGASLTSVRVVVDHTLHTDN